MRTITVAQLRQNPTEAINAAQSGEPFFVTKHGRVVARLMPPERDPWVKFEDVRDLFTYRDDVWAAEIEAERNADRIDPTV
ncbi:type II toxin-antitoxin system Phd/YefM family antitoxin [uncultured Amnibacterium sp.]|uniref:type II toxin-antitoxin system Phd/YefM family antitoxin n=1 Tax=uncultured Amnibacterium sp. TaxID=1631851 RepID=UPI0035CB2A2A